MTVRICEVGPRDGLQNESTVLPPQVRAELVNRLASAGASRVESASFVHPKLVPAMAQAEDVVAGIERRPGTEYTGLVLNERGYDRAIAAGVDSLRYGLAASDEFGRRNQGQSTEEGLTMARRLVERAHADGKRIEVTLMVSFGCPFTGRVNPGHVVTLVEQLMAADPPDEISLADTIGVGVPSQVKSLFTEAADTGATLGAHFHNTRNTGFANAIAALDAGVRTLDASVGGTGGCPFAPRATGNIATEDLIYMLHGMGLDTGIDLEALISVSQWLSQQLGKELPGMVAKAGTFDGIAA